MDLPSFADTFAGFLFNEPATSNKEEVIEIVEWKMVLAKIMGELKKEPQLMEKLESFMRTSHPINMAFIRCLLSNSAVKRMIGEYAAKCKQQIKMDKSGKKNATKAASIRLQGNSLYVKKEYRAAFKMFTRGLMFAKDDDEETPLLYANRSAVYFNLKQYENALEDIERALKFGYGNLKPTGKLLIRKGFSLLALGRDDQAKELLNANLPGNEDGHDRASKWQHLKKQSANVNRQITKRDITMSQFQNVSKISAALSSKDVFRPHERFPWLNAKVDLRYDEKEKGYHLVSKEELKYGEIVALSKPFVCLDPKRDSYERCHYCMVPCFETPKYFTDKPKPWNDSKLSSDSLRMATPLACPECSNVLYCSEACRTAAWTAYHRFECSQMTLLTKIDIESHLALRMLYKHGSFDENSPTQQMLNWCETTADHGALMIDQQAFSFVYSNPIAELNNVEMNIERTLTGAFLLKLVQMSDMLNAPKNLADQVYLVQVGKGFISLILYLCQGELNESVPFTDSLTGNTVSDSPYLSVDGMTTLMKYSCEATVAPYSLLTESLESNVKLLYATGAIAAGTVLTLAYESETLRYTLDCPCTRCVRAARDCLDISTGVYYPIGCSLCGELMVRAAGGSYRCSSSDGCNFKYTARKMKNIYERVRKLMEAKSSSPLCYQEPFSTLTCKVYQLKTAIDSTAPLLYGRSLSLAQLYSRLACGYLLLALAPIVNVYTGFIGERITSLTPKVHRGHLTTGLLYTNKVLDILERLKQGPGIRTLFAEELGTLFGKLDIVQSNIVEQGLSAFQVSIEQATGRYEAIRKMTAYDTMVASSLAAKE